LRIYLASPGSQMHGYLAQGMPVLMSFACWKEFLRDWLPSFDRLMLDSGAFSELNSGVTIDLDQYIDWVQSLEWAEAWAGLDDIRGDWRRSLKNYERGGFPTIHDTDPKGLLSDLIELARERGGWLGVGLEPPRQGKEHWMRQTLEQIPEDIHIHGWACGIYTHLQRLDSVDSTHWWREAGKIRQLLPWLTYGEAVEIAVKKVQRWKRREAQAPSLPLFKEEEQRGES
jgi:hypothetical protein